MCVQSQESLKCNRKIQNVTAEEDSNPELINVLTVMSDDTELFRATFLVNDVDLEMVLGGASYQADRTEGSFHTCCCRELRLNSELTMEVMPRSWVRLQPWQLSGSDSSFATCSC